MRKMIWMSLLVCWVLFIFYNSLQSDSMPVYTSIDYTNWVMELFHLNKDQFMKTLLLVRKTAHLIEFSVAAILTYFTFRAFSELKNKDFLLIFFLVSIIGVFDELIQGLTIGRSPLLSDVGIDMIGAIIGLTFAFIFHNLVIKISQINHLPISQS